MKPIIPIIILLAIMFGAASALTQFNLTDGSDTVIIFNGTAGSTTWTAPTGVSSVWYLVVAGGGGGGAGAGGGGGAGGVLNGTASGLSGSYTIVLGNGGLGVSNATGTNGTFSLFGSYNSTGGGAGGYWAGGGGGSAGAAGAAGGSGGGGGGGHPSLSGAGGSGISGQGQNGSSGATTANAYPGGGGGGNGSVGNVGNATRGGIGGSGFLSSITGTSSYYAAGGGGAIYLSGTDGGIGGSGIGGKGGNGTIIGYDAVANTGSGGGGGGRDGTNNWRGGNGSVGVVIIRYTTPASIPVPSFTSNVTSGYPPLPVQFNDTSVTSITAWNWSYQGTGGGNTTQTWWSQIQNATGVFTTNNYNIHLNATNATGTATTTGDYWINVSAPTPPVASFTKNATQGLQPMGLSVTDTTTNTPTSWEWSWGDGTANSTTKNPTHTYLSGGTYSIDLTATNVFGSSSSGPQTVSVYNQTTASFTPLTFSIPKLPVQSLTFTSTSVNASWYNWSFWNGTWSNGTVNNVVVSSPFSTVGNYTVNLTTSDNGWGLSTVDGYVNVTNVSTTVAFGCTPLGGYTHTTLFTCSDYSTGYAPNNWTWDLGDGKTSTSQNPTGYNYTHNGVYDVNLTVYNSTAGFSSLKKSAYITISTSGGLSGFNRQDILMEGIYTLQVQFKDAVSHAPIPVVQVIDSNGGNQTTSTGLYTGSFNYSVIVIYASSSGYASVSRSYVMDEDRSATVYLSAYTPPSNITPVQSTWYTPKQIGITVVRYSPAGVHVPNARVALNANETTLPAGWLQSAYGMNASLANEMMNGTLIMAGTTGGDGVTAFTVLSSIGYDVAVTDPVDSKVYNTFLYPPDYTYTVWIGASAIAVNRTSIDPLNNTALYITQPNVGNVTLNLRYQDRTGLTTDVHFIVKSAGNMTTVWDADLGNPGTGILYGNKTYLNVRGDAYYYYFNATRSV